MAAAIRKLARATVATLNLCLNPLCLHTTRDPKCSCCRKGCGSKKGRKR